MTKKLSLLFALMLSTLMASAYDAKVDGVYYNLIAKAKLAEVTRGDTEYTGSVTIPESFTYNGVTYSVTSIGSYAFGWCYKFTSVTIPNSVTSIGENAFSGCSNLTSVTIPNSVTSIGNEAFYGTAWYNKQPDGLVYAGLVAYKYKGTMPANTSITIKEGTLGIGGGAFYDCSGLTSITIPNSVTSIGGSAFSGCKGLTSVTIPNSVTSIGGYAFYKCSGLTSVTIPNSVTSIGEYAFSFCSGLTKVTLNSNAIASKSYSSSSTLGSIFGSQVKELILGNEVTAIGSYAFGGCKSLTSITIPNSVTSIGNEAFYNTNLSTLIVGSGVLSFGSNAFYAKPIKTIWLTNTPPQNYTVAQGAVNYVANNNYTSLSNKTVYPFLSSMFVVDGIRYVPVSPSERTCDAIDCVYNESAEKINIGEKVTNKGISLTVKQVCPYTCYKNTFIKDVNLSFTGHIGNNAFNGCSQMKTAELGKDVSSVGNNAFSGCSKLESIEIPDAVTSIGTYSFSNCSTLSSAKIGNGVKAIPSYTFSGCSSLKDAQIGKNITSIGEYAFNGCSTLPKIQIPQSVTSIANYAFSGCSGLKTVIMDNGDSDLSLSSNGSNPMFADCPLDSVYIGRNITYNTSSSYGYSPFYRNTSLRTVVITDKETEISDNEFYGCTNLQSFKVGDGVTKFGKYAFSGCSSLNSLSFGTKLQSIGQEAFSDCVAITSIVSKVTTPPVCGSQALDDISKWDCVLYVPEGTISTYQAANQWKEFFFIEEGDPFAVLRGDANGDGEVNVGDLVSVSNYMAGDGSVSKDAADVNEDGEVNVGDMVVISNIMSGNE